MSYVAFRVAKSWIVFVLSQFCSAMFCLNEAKYTIRRSLGLPRNCINNIRSFPYVNWSGLTQIKIEAQVSRRTFSLSIENCMYIRKSIHYIYFQTDIANLKLQQTFFNLANVRTALSQHAGASKRYDSARVRQKRSRFEKRNTIDETYFLFVRLRCLSQWK